MNFNTFSNIPRNLLLHANFGLEREGLRVTEKGMLSMKPHPEVFGDRNSNPYITTDFSESQLELVTPVFHSAKDAVSFLDSIYNIAVLELKDEYIWPQSMPSITPDEQDIPVAASSSQKDPYKEYVLDKYGSKKQLISGIHINFSLGDELIQALHKAMDKDRPLEQFKNDLYLKMARNYLRYNWLIVYLLGSSNTVHETFTETCEIPLDQISRETYSGKNVVSIRNSRSGYRNTQLIQPDYSSLPHYIDSINAYIDKGALAAIRELYAPVRVKNTDEFTPENLLKGGIQYIEIRNIDCNPYVKSGLIIEDVEFMHIFLLYCLAKEESHYEHWQAECDYNSKKVAIKGQDIDINLIKDGQDIAFLDWGMELLNEMLEWNYAMKLPFEQILQDKMDVLKQPELTYSYRISKQCEDEGFIGTYIKLAKRYKKEAFEDRFRLRPYTDLELSTQALMKECIKRGIRIEVIDRKENFLKLTKGGNVQLVKQATKTNKDSYIAVLVMENKTVTKQILHQNGISVPLGEEFDDMAKAVLALDKWENRPVAIKPKSTNFGLAVSVFPDGASKQDVKKALEIAFKQDGTVLIEPFIKGKEYRFLVIGGETVAVLHRIPANIMGDGKSTISELITRENLNPLRGKGYKTPLEQIEIDDHVILFLRQHGLTVSSILEKGQLQYLRENSNVSTGGESIDVTDDIPERFKKLAVSAAKAVGAHICGVDMMIEDAADEQSSYSIIELNFNPAIHMHCYPLKGKERNIAYSILQLLDFA
ncbi:MAG: bifunctional glutamate--cysteine ligase GshA/glutathione synthetase GshB [Bacillus sp. (in: firmicutes)]